MRKHLIILASAALSSAVFAQTTVGGIQPTAPQMQQIQQGVAMPAQPQQSAVITPGIGAAQTAPNAVQQLPSGGTATMVAPALPVLPAAGNLDTATQALMPLGPDDIRQLRKRLEDAKKATAERPGGLPKPTVTTMTVDLSPGATPPIVRATPYHGATVGFVDASGAPWSVIRVVNFTGSDFVVDVPVPEGSSITVAAQTSFGSGNIAVYLKDLATPIVVALSSGQKEMDYRVDLRIPRRGPNAPSPVVMGEAAPVFDKVMIDLLDGVAPQQAVPLKISGAPNTKAWRVGEKLVLRTSMNVVGYRSRLASGDGMAVYELSPTPVVLATEGGVMRQIQIEGL